MQNITQTFRGAWLAIFMVLGLASSLVWAHPDGHGAAPPVSRQDVESQADTVRRQLIQQGALAGAWTDTAIESTDIKDTAYGSMWIVKYRNAEEADPDKRDLYIFIDEVGNVIAANFIGTLEAD